VKLVVAESPAKAKTIEKYLGPIIRKLAGYWPCPRPAAQKVCRSHHGFAMEWETYADKARQVKAIADEAKNAETLILATDPDREGEAISWHVQELLRKRKALPAKVERVTFNAITKSAVTEAMTRPRELDADLIDAYRARRALDYLVGFTLSPILWRKLPGAKSAGRVQSVALRLIVDREREIELFRPQEYWSVSANFEADGQPFTARLVQLDGTKIERLTIGNKGDADAGKAVVEAGRFTVASVETKPFSRNPPPPFTTSTLQQEAARKLGFAASHTMRIAQQLYEDGLITYMRTDGLQMADEAVSAARRAVADRYDAGYLPDKPRFYATKAKNAQEAHEAIRPTDFTRARAASGDHGRLYALSTTARLPPDGLGTARADDGKLADAGRGLRDGPGRSFLAISLYEEGRDEKDDEESGRMPALRVGDAPAKTGVEAVQSFTQPPPRYSEASLVKRLEELGIGRPSTYAATLQTLKDREYVRMEKARFVPEESGRLVTAFLERFFEKYVSYDYTAELEEGWTTSPRRLGWQKMLEDSGATSSQGRRSHGAKAVGSDGGTDEFLAPALSRQGRRFDAPMPACGEDAVARRPLRRLRRLLQLSRVQIYAEVWVAGRRRRVRTDELGRGSVSSPPLGLYVEQGQARPAAQGCSGGRPDWRWRNGRCRCRAGRASPDTGKPIVASIGPGPSAA
jgi:DNA topoisomerase-1